MDLWDSVSDKAERERICEAAREALRTVSA